MEKTIVKTIGSKVYYFLCSIRAKSLSDEVYLKWIYKKYMKKDLD